MPDQCVWGAVSAHLLFAAAAGLAGEVWLSLQATSVPRQWQCVGGADPTSFDSGDWAPSQ